MVGICFSKSICILLGSMSSNVTHPGLWCSQRSSEDVEGSSPLHRGMLALCRSTSVKGFWTGRAGSLQESPVWRMGAWFWTPAHFICSEHCLRTAAFVQRQDSTPATCLQVKVTTRDFTFFFFFFRVFNHIFRQVLPGFVGKLNC